MDTDSQVEKAADKRPQPPILKKSQTGYNVFAYLKKIPAALSVYEALQNVAGVKRVVNKGTLQHSRLLL